MVLKFGTKSGAAKRDAGNLEIRLDHLRLFVAVAEHRGIAPAARALDLTPSAATRQLMRLEALLKVRLFQRTTRAVRLTEAGAVVLNWAKSSLVGYDAMYDDLEARNSSPSGLIRLITHQYAGLQFLPPLLAQFCATYPDIRLSITMTDRPINMVERSFDLGIQTGDVDNGSMVAIPLQHIDRVLCASATYIERNGPVRKLADLESHRCLAHAVHDADQWLFRTRGGRIIPQAINRVVEADSIEMLVRLVRSDMGIARLGSEIARSEIASERMVRVLPELDCYYPKQPAVSLVYPSRKVLYRTRLLIDFLRRSLQTP